MKVNNQREGESKHPLGYRGIGIRRSHHHQTLDVVYGLVWEVYPDSALDDLCGQLFTGEGEGKNGLEILNPDKVEKILQTLAGDTHASDLGESNLKALNQYLNFFQALGEPKGSDYHNVDFAAVKIFDLNSEPECIEDVYFRLQLISRRLVLPHGINLSGVFGLLPTLVWSNQGPFFIEDFTHFRDQSLWGNHPPLTVTHVDKFPYLVNYYIPEGVRIAEGSRVRLGAYLGKGTTVMPAGYVNFNAGTRGAAMVEGRVSGGVLVGESSDIGGGASIMGTLSGGNKHIIEIGAKCLLGANSGTGISLGFGCTIAAGTYVTAGSKVYLYDQKMNPVDLEGNSAAGKNIVKALELSGRDNLLFYLDTSRGHLICRPNSKTISLNPNLHAGAV